MLRREAVLIEDRSVGALWVKGNLNDTPMPHPTSSKVDASGFLRVWDWQNTTSEPLLSENEPEVDTIAWAHQSTTLAIGRLGRIDLMDLVSGEKDESIAVGSDDPAAAFRLMQNTADQAAIEA